MLFILLFIYLLVSRVRIFKILFLKTLNVKSVVDKIGGIYLKTLAFQNEYLISIIVTKVT